ncbi:hypothetical protein FJ930_19815 [Mesorhizobium sp. B2-4-15]|uniref:hypothetical protein n=1 Tax=Mesorhizobium sp. B2-4-15 TaxID=2589934 RepID=UPI00114EDA42|nr:hypothetical protein [Mesorhizobium sp. B2-4-15]TPK70216.1 hypothetical protein FJ930_19815 [Mesorhizobium sp. B2-4-15]
MVKGLILAALIALAGCTTTKGSFCAIASPQRPSAAAVDTMTDAQVKALLAHNKQGQKLCGWKP